MWSTFNSIPPCLAWYHRAGIIRKARKSLIFLVFLSRGSEEECKVGKLAVQFLVQPAGPGYVGQLTCQQLATLIFNPIKSVTVLNINLELEDTINMIFPCWSFWVFSSLFLRDSTRDRIRLQLSAVTVTHFRRVWIAPEPKLVETKSSNFGRR